MLCNPYKSRAVERLKRDILPCFLLALSCRPLGSNPPTCSANPLAVAGGGELPMTYCAHLHRAPLNALHRGEGIKLLAYASALLGVCVRAVYCDAMPY